MTEPYVTNWTAVLVVALVGALAVLLMFIASRVLAPKRHSDIKNSPYECGFPHLHIIGLKSKYVIMFLQYCS